MPSKIWIKTVRLNPPKVAIKRRTPPRTRTEKRVARTAAGAVIDIKSALDPAHARKSRSVTAARKGPRIKTWKRARTKKLARNAVAAETETGVARAAAVDLRAIGDDRRATTAAVDARNIRARGREVAATAAIGEVETVEIDHDQGQEPSRPSSRLRKGMRAPFFACSCRRAFAPEIWKTFSQPWEKYAFF